jgi:hypothetical protein
MILLAHAGHWAVSLLEVSPFFIMVVWLLTSSWRDRRREAKEKDGKPGAPG